MSNIPATNSPQSNNNDNNNSNNNPPQWLTQLADILKPTSNNKLQTPQPEKFVAISSQHATSFIKSMEVYFKLQQNNNKVISDEDKILHTMLNTEAAALLWVQNYINTYLGSSWDTFKSKFIARFTPVNESAEALKFLQEYIKVLGKNDLKQAIDQYTEIFLQKMELVHGVHNQVFALAYQAHLPRTLQGYVESKVREWQAANPDQVTAGNGQPPLNDIITYTTTAVPLCQSQWISNERRYAVKRSSTYRTTSISAMVHDDNVLSGIIDVQTPPIVNNAVASYSNNNNSNYPNKNNYSNRLSNRNRNTSQRNTVPQWVIDYCRTNKLCYRCKEPYTSDTHSPGKRCIRAVKRLDEKLRPQSN
jgi:hypothetical protein